MLNHSILVRRQNRPNVRIAVDAEDPSATAFLTWAKEWWSAPEQLTIVADPSFEQELHIFDAAVALRARQETVPRFYRVIDGTFEEDHVAITLPATLTRRTIQFAITGAQERGEEWDQDPDTLEVALSDRESTAVVTLHPFNLAPKGGSPIDRDEQMRDALRAWKEIDQDTLDILVHTYLKQYENNELTNDGLAYITYDAILDARSIQKKTAKTNGKVYSSGHRQTHRSEVHHSILRLHTMAADIGIRQEGKRRRGQSSPVITIAKLDFVDNTEDGTRDTLAIWFRLGAWAQTIRQERILVPRELLALSAKTESMEKRLGRLLPIMLASSRQPTGEVALSIREVFTELHLSVDRRNPAKTLDRFDKAMKKIAMHNIIGSWRIVPDLVTHPLPARGFLDTWLDRTLVVTPSGTPPLFAQSEHA